MDKQGSTSEPALKLKGRIGRPPGRLLGRRLGDRLGAYGAWLPAVGFAVLPKCPLCLAALGAVGLTSVLSPVYRVGLLALNVAALTLLVAVLFLRRRGLRQRGLRGGLLRGGRRTHGPAVLAVAASLAVLAGKFWLDQAWILAVGLAGVGAATWWSARAASKSVPCETCPAALD